MIADHVGSRERRLFPRMHIPERLAYEFLGTFARCEYALKATGFAKGRRSSVEADWDRFAQAVDWAFSRVQDESFRRAAEFLLTEPPRKQVLIGGRIQWKDSPPNSNHCMAQQVLVMVRRVRNNLFHGGKVWSSEDGDRARDIELLKAGLVVLEQVASLKKDVHRAYEVGAF